MNTTSEQTVRDIVVANSASARVFETLGIDYCCGGNQALSAACARANVPLGTAIGLLAECAQPIDRDVPYDAPLGEMTRYIVDRHHAFVRRESPRIQGLFEKVCEHHGRVHPELSDLKALFAALAQELSRHMMKEERILFPYIASMSDATPPQACFDSIESPIAAMIADHEDAGEILSKMRALSNGYQPPEGACPTFHALYGALAEFERDLHWHVHLENNILFPRALVARAIVPAVSRLVSTLV